MSKLCKFMFLLLSLLGAQADQLFCMDQPHFDPMSDAMAYVGHALMFGMGTWYAYKMIKGERLTTDEKVLTFCGAGMSFCLMPRVWDGFNDMLQHKARMKQIRDSLEQRSTPNNAQPADSTYFPELEQQQLALGNAQKEYETSNQALKKGSLTTASITVPYLIGGAVWCSRYLAARHELVTKH